MASVYTVGQVNSYIKNMFNEDFALNNIGIKGEVSNCKYHSSGHIYFSLKDSSGVIACVMFAGNRRGLKFQMQEGQKVVVFGQVTVYERDGKYQMYAKDITLDGEGDLYRKYEELKRQLEEMGMFDREYKREIPKFAMKVGIVTASTGAAIQDIINISKRRNPYVELILYPAIVQGEEAAPSIVNGIRYLDNEGVDVIIVGRGGGSIEDLWAFNEEIVARAIFDCNTPIISAVGHETDTTIADYVADLRAPTPSAAAELAVFEYSAFLNDINMYRYELLRRLNYKLESNKNKIKNYELRLKNLSPQNILMQKMQYVADIELKLDNKINNILISNKHRLAILSEKLNGLSPLNKLSNGYAYIDDKDKNAIKTVDNINKNDEINIHLIDGVIKTVVTDIERLEA
ncbi:MAG: exodeoxyribonuclease VII large subunit [Lachnospiraceae bacterium]|nr:exodeoxyribonuclease VII large subunit [Lachnospiraceae bacterium]